ncbi:N-acetyltransferase family protein [Microbacterium sp. gxy059]|uniref:GNAT family N-acetyltransferase n=1 Tax=Microbacterium sp. gxy059 TaxID=2957199 RepID=UPI003D9645FB
MAAVRIRPYRPDDHDALAEVCVRTADAGGDATGLLSDDGLWSALFFSPYVERHPDLAFVAERDGAPVGYVVAAPDTRAFESWFRRDWWPRFAARFPDPGDASGREARLVRHGYRYGCGESPPWVADHPAHLHIDLMPAAQGQGVGRRLIEALLAELGARGVPGVHLGADPANAGALAFYERLGFDRLDAGEGSAVFARALR